MAYCEECGGLGEACDECVVDPLRDKIAALEAENDELAARLRAVAKWLEGVTHYRHVDEDANIIEILDGPVPECRACAESNVTVSKLSALVIKSNPFVPVGELWVNPKWGEARHAADEGGGHE